MGNETNNGTTYAIAMACINCGWKGNVRYAEGKEVPRRDKCPNCKCQSLMKTIGGDCRERNWFAETCDVFFNGREAK
jgi:hypothetical protein